MHKILNHPEFGPVTITKKTGTLTIRLSVHPLRGIRVSIPYFTSYSAAERFISDKEVWIRKVVAKQKEKADKLKIIYRDGVQIRTIGRVVAFRPEEDKNTLFAPGSLTSDVRKIRIKVYEDRTDIIYPAAADPEKIQSQLKEALTKYLRHEASGLLPRRAAELAALHGFKYNRIFLKNNTSNWGSCSRLNNINLNIHLVRLTPELCDYVILHELCHLLHRNHGAAFHSLLDSLCGGREKELAKELKRYTTRI
jgi:hypothetical protein